MKKLLEFFQESNGTLSSTRLCFVGFAVVLTLTWAYTSLTAEPRALQSIPWDVAAILGMLMTGKVMQKSKESSE